MNSNNTKGISVNYNPCESYSAIKGFVINNTYAFRNNKSSMNFYDTKPISNNEFDIKTEVALYKTVQDNTSDDSQRNILSKQINLLPSDTDHISIKIYNSFIFDEIQFDTISKTKYMIDKLISDYGYQQVDYSILNLISKEIFISDDEEKIIKFICLLSSIHSNEIPLSFFTAIVSFYNHKSDSVKEAVIMAIEYWESKQAIDYLEKMEPFKRPYLEKYKQNVLTYLKELA